MRTPVSRCRRAVANTLTVARSDDELIRKAAFGLAQTCLAELRDRFGSAHGRAVTLLVGMGKSGADAMVAGKHLRERGVAVHAREHHVSTAPQRRCSWS